MKYAFITATVLFTFAATSSFAAVDKAERKVMEKLGQGNSSEVDLAKQVEPKAKNEEVKDFAQRMVTDHEKAWKELEELAKKEHVTLKGGMDAEHKAFARKLAKEKLGEPYDKTYMKDMVKDHEKDKADTEKTLKEEKNPELRKWTEAQLKTVEEHLKLAREIEAKLK